jgi:hypothetical protein
MTGDAEGHREKRRKGEDDTGRTPILQIERLDGHRPLAGVREGENASQTSHTLCPQACLPGILSLPDRASRGPSSHTAASHAVIVL